MRRRLIFALLAAGGMAAALRLSPRSNVIAPTGFDLSGFTVPDIISNTAGYLPARTLVSPVSSHSNSKRLTTAQARALVSELNRSQFGGWFTSGGRSISDIVAIFKVESGLKPDARNNKARSGAWGIGQVLGGTAAGLGVSNPYDLLDARLGALTAMRHLRGTWDDLAARTGARPTIAKWIMTHKEGAAGVARGKFDPIYYARYSAFKLTS